ncbi:class I SAM-dependent DNA methyltransferase [Blastococcus deserti]|uniref:Class I SAM-dependent DNA methyltransferase n=1 Tax=Blastococcus deserti TaxID=2259033 RepID=A0ABW4XB08_9ACTN
MASGFDPSEYGRHIAEVYDELHADLSPEAALSVIAGYAAGGAVLELGIGTGRIALPLAAKGLDVEGIEGSPEMVAQLRRKPGGEALRVEVGDFSTTTMDRRYAVVVLAYNTINALPSQDAQVQTFRNAAAHLDPSGVFLVENWVPDVAGFHHGRAVRAHEVAERHVIVEVAELRPAEQRISATRLAFTADGVRLLPVDHRYVWPAELDLMARLAGLHLEERWQDWERRPFTDQSTTYVAVYRRDD